MRWWLWPNLLSLDAPVVALLWHAAFARALGEGVNIITAILLVSAVWVIYVGDRLLDGRRALGCASGRACTRRQAFHAAHAAGFLAGAAVVSVAGLVLLMVLASGPELWGFGAVMGLASGGYAWAVQGERGRWMPKELLCGLLFSAGVVGGLFLEPFPWWEAAGFALLCGGNCLVIACAEAGIDRQSDPGAAPQRWDGVGSIVGPGLGLLSVAGVAGWIAGRPLAGAIGLAALGLWWVLVSRRDLVWKRVMADAVLLSPIVFWPVL